MCPICHNSKGFECRSINSGSKLGVCTVCYMSQTGHTWSFEPCVRALVLYLMIVKIICVHYSLYYSSWNDVLEWSIQPYEYLPVTMIWQWHLILMNAHKELWICSLYNYGIILWMSSLFFMPWSGVVWFEQLILTLSNSRVFMNGFCYFVKQIFFMQKPTLNWF